MSAVHIQQFKSWITKNNLKPLMTWFQEQKHPDALHWRELGEQVYLHHQEPMTFLLEFTSAYLNAEEQALETLKQFSAHTVNINRVLVDFNNIYSGLSSLPNMYSQNPWSLVTHASLEDKQRWTAQWMQRLESVFNKNRTLSQRIDLERPFLEWSLRERYIPLIINRIGSIDKVYKDDIFIRSYLRHGHPDDWHRYRTAMIGTSQDLTAFHQLLWETSWRLLSLEPIPFPLTSAFFEWVERDPYGRPLLMNRFQGQAFVPVGSLTELNTSEGGALDSAVLWSLLKSATCNPQVLAHAAKEWDTVSKLTPEETIRYNAIRIGVDMEISPADLSLVWQDSASPSTVQYSLVADTDSGP